MGKPVRHHLLRLRHFWLPTRSAVDHRAIRQMLAQGKRRDLPRHPKDGRVSCLPPPLLLLGWHYR